MEPDGLVAALKEAGISDRLAALWPTTITARKLIKTITDYQWNLVFSMLAEAKGEDVTTAERSAIVDIATDSAAKLSASQAAAAARVAQAEQIAATQESTPAANGVGAASSAAETGTKRLATNQLAFSRASRARGPPLLARLATKPKLPIFDARPSPVLEPQIALGVQIETPSSPFYRVTNTLVPKVTFLARSRSIQSAKWRRSRCRT